MSNVDHLSPATPLGISEKLAVPLPAVLAIVIGALFVYGAGIAQPSTIHNAAHDARHAFVFPCH